MTSKKRKADQDYSIEETYQFHEHKSSNLRGKVDGNLINNNQKDEDDHLQKPSQTSQPSHTLVSNVIFVYVSVERSLPFWNRNESRWLVHEIM